MFQENSIETCILSRVKQITGPGWMHETSARTWCTVRTWREQVGRQVGGGKKYLFLISLNIQFSSVKKKKKFLAGLCLWS